MAEGNFFVARSSSINIVIRIIIIHRILLMVRGSVILCIYIGINISHPIRIQFTSYHIIACKENTYLQLLSGAVNVLEQELS